MPKRSDQTFVDLMRQAGELDSKPLKGARLLPLDRIDPNPSQSRQSFDEGALAELAASITAQGVLQPILVRPTASDRWQVVAGERRTRAARLAGLTSIPALIREMTAEEAAYATAIENLQREDLDIEDEARQYQALLELTGLSQRALAGQLGVDHVYLSRRVKLLKHPDLMTAYRAGRVGLLDALATVDADQGSGTVSQRNTEPELVERDELDSRPSPWPDPVPAAPAAPLAPEFRYRFVDQAFKQIARIQPQQMDRQEAATVADQLEELQTTIARRIEQLRQRAELLK